MDSGVDYFLCAAAVAIYYVSRAAGAAAAGSFPGGGHSGRFCVRFRDDIGNHVHAMAFASRRSQSCAVIHFDLSFHLAVGDVSVCRETGCSDLVWDQGEPRGMGRVSSVGAMGTADSEYRPWRRRDASIDRSGFFPFCFTLIG
jgi:hypothetical protein